MRRCQLFEIHDWAPCPRIIRNGLTDFLQTSIDVLDTYGPIRTRLLAAIEQSGSAAVVDLCSGAGGPWLKWSRQGLVNVPITLTDKFPNVTAMERLAGSPVSALRYLPVSIDATAVPSGLQGFRTIFTALHHFTPSQAKAIIEDAIRNREGIGIFEFTSRTFANIVSMLLTPLGVWLFTPLIKNVRWQALALTYLIPLIPMVVCIDGILSCLRSYNDSDLTKLASCPDYRWVSGEARGITYLIGSPLPENITSPPRISKYI